MTLPVQIRPYRPGDEEGILALFNEVFSETDPTFRPRPMEHWRWQFAENPLGHDTFVAQEEGGRIVGTYTSIPGRWRLMGREVRAAQAVDTCVHARYRRSLKREGLFLRLAGAWFDHFGRPDRDPIVWGLPNPQAFRIGTRRLDYRPVHSPLRSLNRNFDAAWIEWLEAGTREPLSVREVAEVPSGADELFERTLGREAFVQVRDASYLRWRYLRCPTRRYRLLEARSADGALRGLLVLLDRWGVRPITPLVDWIVAGDDTEAQRALLLAAARRAAAAGSSCLETWVPLWSSHAKTLRALGFADDDSPFHLCIRVFGPPIDETWARDHWFVQMGDSDCY